MTRPRTIRHRFPIGPMPRAFLDILSYAPNAKQTRSRMDYGRTWRYVVQFHCCDREQMICHRAIMDRLNRPMSVCRYCSLEKGWRDRHGLIAGDEPWIDVPWPPASTARPRP